MKASLLLHTINTRVVYKISHAQLEFAEVRVCLHVTLKTKLSNNL